MQAGQGVIKDSVPMKRMGQPSVRMNNLFICTLLGYLHIPAGILTKNALLV